MLRCIFLFVTVSGLLFAGVISTEEKYIDLYEMSHEGGEQFKGNIKIVTYDDTKVDLSQVKKEDLSFKTVEGALKAEMAYLYWKDIDSLDALFKPGEAVYSDKEDKAETRTLALKHWEKYPIAAYQIKFIAYYKDYAIVKVKMHFKNNATSEMPSTFVRLRKWFFWSRWYSTNDLKANPLLLYVFNDNTIIKERTRLAEMKKKSEEAFKQKK